MWPQALQEQMKSVNSNNNVLAVHAAKTLSVMFQENRELKQLVSDIFRDFAQVMAATLLVHRAEFQRRD